MTDKHIKNSDVGAFLVSAPLYTVATVDGAPIGDMAEDTVMLGGVIVHKARLEWEVPTVLKKDCRDCGGVVTWELVSSFRSTEPGERVLSFFCRSCRRQSFSVWLDIRFFENGTRLRLEKVGQSPKLEIAIPKDLEKALGTRVDLYRRGIMSRHNGFGIGALTYFRRVIEETTGDMLALLERVLLQQGKTGTLALRKLQEARASTRFEDKVKLAAKHLPPHLRPDGLNPFGDLYQLLSDGLHARSDAECCDIVDGMNVALTHIYTRLKAHVEQDNVYVTAAQEIRAKVAKRKKERSG